MFTPTRFALTISDNTNEDIRMYITYISRKLSSESEPPGFYVVGVGQDIKSHYRTYFKTISDLLQFVKLYDYEGTIELRTINKLIPSDSDVNDLYELTFPVVSTFDWSIGGLKTQLQMLMTISP